MVPLERYSLKRERDDRMMIHTLKNLLMPYEVEAITKENFDEVMDIYESNQAFFILTEEKEIGKEDCMKDVDAIPPDFDISQKIFTSIEANNQKVAVLDMLMGYPAESCLWIGLLLIHEAHKHKGLGRQIISAIEKAAKTEGYESVQLGVIEKNGKALSFWHMLGFEVIREAKMEKEGSASVKVIVMEKRIKQEESV